MHHPKHPTDRPAANVLRLVPAPHAVALSTPVVALADVAVVNTTEAARALGRSPATLQRWATTGGPIAPRRINGRLGWPVAELRRILAGAA